MPQPSSLLAHGEPVLFFGQTGKTREGIVVGSVRLTDGECYVDAYMVETKWEIRPVPMRDVVAPGALADLL